ncbi:MAG: hypothetical protein ACJAYU_002454 [Bradymonadia bacterium]|jgi:hypothetical protein
MNKSFLEVTENRCAEAKPSMCAEPVNSWLFGKVAVHQPAEMSASPGALVGPPGSSWVTPSVGGVRELAVGLPHLEAGLF